MTLPCSKTIAALLITAGVSGASMISATASEDVCVYKTQSWSLMRHFVEEVSKQTINRDIAAAAKLALEGAETHEIHDFEITYARGKTGMAPPNDEVCFPKTVDFSVVINTEEDESAFQCNSTWRNGGGIEAISCELTAG